MTIHIIREDITKIRCDVIINPTNQNLTGEGSLDNKIHKLAGEELDKECKKISNCEIGQAILTKGYNLKSKYIIHTVGPKWIDGKSDEESKLRSCYKSCLQIIKDKELKSAAFPIISSGTYNYPKEKAFKIAVEEIQNFLKFYEMDVYIVVFDIQTTYISKKLFDDVKEYIDDNYTKQEEFYYQRKLRTIHKPKIRYDAQIYNENICEVDDIEIKLDESFSESLIQLIDERGLKDSECYKKANVDRKLFNKIKNNKNYHPRKETAISLALALELDLIETNELLSKAGYILTNSFMFDVIIQYFIKNKIYDIMLINETLYSFDQKLLSN